MPHINRIRVNNVKYNFGTQYYDDFLMRFSCKNTIYDLANGGGKSVLMLLLFQNLIPNCTLDDKQPIEKLFRTNDGSTTIHSLIEWRLSDDHIKNNFQYMLTGFCARKAKDEGEVIDGEIKKNAQAIEYFNYCIFYRKFNDNDIKNLPLSKGKERVSYTGLKNYLKNLAKNDMSLEVHIFERKGDYQRFIAQYGLYESEWEIIRGINKTEGHVRTYFETRYRTARKVVEDLLVEGIIEKSFRNNYSGKDDDDRLANTLLNIKDKLIELSRKKDEINHFDIQIANIDSFIQKVELIRQMYVGMEDTFEEIRKIYQTILESSQDYEKIREEKRVHLDDVIEQKKTFAQKLDTARILIEQDELAKLQTALKFVEEEVEKAEKSVSEFDETLNQMEGTNSYLDYVEAKEEYDKLTVVMDNILKDNGEITRRLEQMVAIKKIWDAEQSAHVEEELGKEREKFAAEDESIQHTEDERRNADKAIAVLQYEINEQTEQIAAFEQELNTLKNEVGILLPAQAEEELRRREQVKEQLSDQISKVRKELDDVREKKLRTKVIYDSKKLSLEEQKKTYESEREQLDKVRSVLERVDKLKEVYQESDIQILETKISHAYKDAVIALSQERKQLQENEEKLQQLSEHICGESTDVKKALAYIRRYYTESAVSGAQYLAKLSDKERITLLRSNPLLVNSIIVSEKIDEIMTDYDIPVEHMVAVMQFSEVQNMNTSMCYIGNPDKYTDADIERQYMTLKNQMEDARYHFTRKEENETVIGEDLLFIKMVSEGLLSKKDSDSAKNVEEILGQIEKMEQEIYQLTIKSQQLDEQEELLNKSFAEFNLSLGEMEKECTILEKMMNNLHLCRETEKKRAENNVQIVELKKKYLDIDKRLEAMLQVHENRGKKIQAYQAVIEELQTEWKSRYEKYFNESVYSNYKGKTIAELQAEFIGNQDIRTILQGLLSALASENSSLSDKEQLLNNYQISMQRSLMRLDYLGLSKELFDEKYQAKELFRYKQEEMQDKKKKREDADKLRRQLRRNLDSKRTQRDKFEGKISHLIQAVENNYGEFTPEILENSDIYALITENEVILNSIEHKIENCKNEIKELDEKNVITAMLLKNCDRLMKKSGIYPDSDTVKYTGLSAAEIESKYNEASEKLDKFIKDRYQCGEEFERELQMLCDLLKVSEAAELADELRMNVRIPDSMTEANQLIQSLRETNEMIVLEKERVEKGLTDIQVIKENFENQCLQTCINIKTELERLTRLSKITMENQQISMIQLRIPYINEELYKDRMSVYIDRTVNDADEYDNQEQRLKFIRNNLSWKKMFSVIVTDMNGIKLNLYKRERISAQSRYLPYEEAVGSTGQSQGIYIQFLISIINYISSINSKNSDATGLRKVIFIDNPFGAAKDSYIWEPIFKLLKTNNVQLIVPARGATPAITGKFDVNYILGQKMISGKQQTVVVNYYSNVKTDELDYSTLSFEQTSLF